jgi:rfaE bifunctional protein nucleotidyltransferase chain/domain
VGVLISLAEAEALGRDLRQIGAVIVLTNGVFDLLHIGHVRYLRAARDLGDVLFVGMNSDRSVREIKGSGHPFVRAEERAEILCALASVDYVVVFGETTAIRLIKSIRPHIYAKGGDYAAYESPGAKPLPEAAVVQRLGGTVEILPLEATHSTTCLAERIASVVSEARGGKRAR